MDMDSDIHPVHAQIFIIPREWLSRQPSRSEWDVWVVMGLIGFIVGMVGFLLHQLIDLIADFRYEFASDLIVTDGLAMAWFFTIGYSLCFLVPAAAIVVYLRPSAARSEFILFCA